MFTKKTRVISAIAIVCMLLSLMASFCLPAAAESNYDEIVPSKGLTDVSALPDIKNGFDGANKAYKVTDRAGMEIIAKQVARKSKMEGYTFTLANDIDMSGTPFMGIGSPSLNDIDSAANAALTYNKDFYTFRGTFDGNGFVFTNLYMYIGSTYGVGLFGNCYNATIKNVGIASGLIVGADRTGSIVGIAHGDTKLINCWNAATVIGGGTDGAGGLVGAVLDGKATLKNCYNLGLVYNNKNAAAGLVGVVRQSGSGFAVNNSYSAGTLIDGFKGLDSSSIDYFGAIMRIQNEEIATSTKSADNYYLNNIGKPGWALGKEVAKDAFDGATVAEDFSQLHNDLNKNISSDSEDYNVAYEYSEAGYPVLTYKKDGAVVAKRLAAFGAKNVARNDWAAENALFAKISAGAHKNGALNFAGAPVEIASADDLFIFSLFAGFNSISSNFGVSEVVFTEDVNMDDLTLADVEYYVPIGANSTVNYNIDGRDHTLYNWKSYTYHSAASNNASGGFIHEINGSFLKNFSMENAVSCYDQCYKVVAEAGNTYPALLVEMVNGSAYLQDVSVTGEIRIIAKAAANDNNNAGLVGRHWNNALTAKNCWSETTVTHVFSDTSYVARAIGSHPSSASVSADKYSNVYWVAPADAQVAATEDGNPVAKDEIQLRITSENFHNIQTAQSLNEASKLLGEDLSIFWTVGERGGKAKLVRSSDESRRPVLLLVQRYIAPSLGNTEAVPYGPADRYYYYKGHSYVIGPDDLPGYLLENGTPNPVVLNDDYTTIKYYMDQADTSFLGEAEDFVDTFGESGGEYIQKLNVALQKVQSTGNNAAKRDALYEVAVAFNEAKEAVKKGDLWAEYPYLPSISRYNELAGYNFTDWAISSKEDWVYVTNMLPTEAVNLKLHLTNHIDMQGTSVKPLAFGATFIGLVDGHGYNFYNFKMDMTDPNGFGGQDSGAVVFDNSFGLVAHLGNGGIIRNIGLASGAIDIKKVCSQDQGIGAFAGVAESGSLIANCWNALSVKATNKSSVSRIGGIVGRGAGVLYGCYNLGAVSGNTSYAHGLNAYASNGTGRFYNCYSLPASSPAANYNAAIGQGGGYQTAADAATKPATPYQNTYSIDNYLIYQYKTHPSAAIVECSENHTLAREEYDSGFMAYTMNKNRYDYSDLAPIYWTLDDEGKTVYGNEANAVCKLTLTVDDEVIDVRYVNGNATFEVTYDTYDVSDVEVVIGDATVSGEFNNVLTMNGTDVEIALTVGCRHTGTLTYTPDADGNTHSWSCSACDASEQTLLCTNDGEWVDNGDETHSAFCVCGREFTENCQFNNPDIQAGDTHLLSCICGADKAVDCEYDIAKAENNQHRKYCTICGDWSLLACSFGPWEVVKYPSHDEEGEKRRECICGNYETESIDKYTEPMLILSSPVAHAGDEVEFTVNLAGIPATGVSGLALKIEYDSDIFEYVGAQAKKGGLANAIENKAGEQKIAFIWPENITDGTDVATLTFKVAKGASAGESVVKVSPLDAIYIPDGAAGSMPITFVSSENPIKVAAYAWGDANGDKYVTLADVIRMLRKVNGEDITLDAAADVNGNGVVDTSDASWVLKQLMLK